MKNISVQNIFTSQWVAQIWKFRFQNHKWPGPWPEVSSCQSIVWCSPVWADRWCPGPGLWGCQRWCRGSICWEKLHWASDPQLQHNFRILSSDTSRACLSSNLRLVLKWQIFSMKKKIFELIFTWSKASSHLNWHHDRYFSASNRKLFFELWNKHSEAVHDSITNNIAHEASEDCQPGPLASVWCNLNLVLHDRGHTNIVVSVWCEGCLRLKQF